MRRPLKSKHIIVADPIYNSTKVAKLINYVLKEGKKEVARKIVYSAFDSVKETTKQDPVEVFEEALKNASPFMEVRTRRVGGANYQIPHEVTPERRLTLGLRWLLAFARAKKGSTMAERLAGEIVAASRNEGEAVKKRENVHKMAEANRAFAHFARGPRKAINK